MPTKVPRDEEQRQLQRLQMEIQYHETLETRCPSPARKSVTFVSAEPKLPKKRGPKKKQMTPSRVARFKVRRIKANGRERDRMKGLNEQLEVLRETIPCFSLSQKLSKIETLRLAKNYIDALSKMVASNEILDNTQFAQLLCQGLSPNTMNLVAATLSLNPRVIHQNDACPMDENYILSSMHPRADNALEFINLKKSLTSESEDDRGIYSSTSLDQASSYGGDLTSGSSSLDDMSPMQSMLVPEQVASTYYTHDESHLMFTDPGFYSSSMLYPPNPYYSIHY